MKILTTDINLTKFRQYSLCALAFTLPLAIDVSRPFLVTMIVIGFADNIINKKFTLRIKGLNPILLLPLLFTIQLLSFTFLNDNNVEGLAHLEKYLAFLLMPLAIVGLDQSQTDNSKIFKYFIWGNVCACIACLLIALGHSLSYESGSVVFDARLEKDPRISFLGSVNWGGNYFFSVPFSAFHHPTYFSIYLIFCLGLLLKFDPQIVPGKSKIPIIVFFSIILLLLSSRASQFFYILLVLYTILFNKKTFKVRIAYSILLALLICIISFNPRSSEIKDRIYAMSSGVSPDDRSSIGIRFLIWSSAINIINKSPIVGVGVGDLRDELEKQYSVNNYEYALESRFNAHNDFLEHFATLGLFGLSIYLAILILGIRHSIVYKDYLFLYFLIIIIIEGCFESIFQRHAAIVFFSLFYPLFLVTKFQTNYASDY